MGYFANIIQKYFSPPKSVEEIQERLTDLGITIEFVIEAGAHDGSDSIKLVNLSKVSRIFCFEPNPYTYKILENRLREFKEPEHFVYQLGLFESNLESELFFPKIDLGGNGEKLAGTTSLSKSWGKSSGQSTPIKLVALDDFLKKDYDNLIHKHKRSCGLLWLDVEGFSLEALKGMPKFLGLISFAKIEVEYGSQPGQWEHRTIFKVTRLMMRHGFLPISGYLHPLTRGDCVYVKTLYLPIMVKIKSIIYLTLMHIFYGLIYPIRSKIRQR